MASIQAPTAYQTKTITVSSSVIDMAAGGWSWTSGYVALADQAVITAFTNPVTLTWDGTAPTTTLGVYVPAGSTVTISGNANVQNIKLIRATSSDAVVSIILEKF